MQFPTKHSGKTKGTPLSYNLNQYAFTKIKLDCQTLRIILLNSAMPYIVTPNYGHPLILVIQLLFEANLSTVLTTIRSTKAIKSIMRS